VAHKTWPDIASAPELEFAALKHDLPVSKVVYLQDKEPELVQRIGTSAHQICDWR
jgi:hypothetical protein